MKKIIFMLIIIILIIIISIKVNYKINISIYFGNNNSSSKYIYRYYDTRIEDIIEDIDNNITINNKNIQNILVKANNIYLDLNELYLSKNFIYDIESLIIKIRSFSKEKIIIILRNNDNAVDNDINKWIFEIKDKYDIIIKR